MKMKHLPIVFFAVLIGFGAAYAQRQAPGAAQSNRLEQLKIAFLTRQIDLTAEEAQQFWPLYNEYQKALAEQRDDRRENFGIERPDIETMTAEEINNLIDERMQQAVDIHESRIAFLQGIREFLPPLKVARYFKAEEQFKRQVLERLRERQESRARPGRR
jgi:Spy/CpxP family protein refolding chaperone